MSSKFPSILYFYRTKVGEPFPLWRIKIMMACLQTILSVDFLTVGNIPLRISSPTLYQPTNHLVMHFSTFESCDKLLNHEMTWKLSEIIYLQLF